MHATVASPTYKTTENETEKKSSEIFGVSFLPCMKIGHELHKSKPLLFRPEP